MQTTFDLDDSIIYLNHAAVSPWPIATSQAIERFANENRRFGSRDYPGWLRTEAELRSYLARLIGCSDREIALLKSTSEGLSFIANGIDWRAGDNIVIPEGEFPSNRLVWKSLVSRGVTVKEIPILHTDRPEEALLAAIDDRTRLLSVSSVQYAYGLRLDLAEMGSRLKSAHPETLFCIDAIQSIGAIRFDVNACMADFVVADGHKWMMSPEGLALFYVRESLIDSLELSEYGWHMMADPGDFRLSNTVISATASRFECGSPNMLGTHALHASIGMILDIGIETIESRIHEHVDHLIDDLQQIPGCQIHSPIDRSRRAGIINFSIDGIESDNLYHDLMQAGVMCASRGPGVRLSPHFYLTSEVLDRAIEKIREITMNQ